MMATELVSTAIGSVLLAFGAVSITASALRRRSDERLLWVFGVACVLYAVRLLAERATIGAVKGDQSAAWSHLIALLTYWINVPAFAFFESLIGRGWQQSVRLAWLGAAGFAIGATGVELTHPPFAAMPVNNPIVLVGLAVIILNICIYRRQIPALFRRPIVAVAAFVFAAFVLNENLGRPISPRLDIEPVGVLIFVVAVGYAVVGSVLRGEAELVAMQRELATARQIQESLLPSAPPRVRGLDVAVCYRPMTAVAGDLYDFIPLSPSRLGVLVADVAGHGVPAALVASMVKLAFSTAAADADDPAAVLTVMNRVLCRHVQRSFVTAVYAVIDTATASVTVANAGHPSVLVAYHGGRVDESDERGLVLGFHEQALYGNRSLPVGPGDRVLLYTDGIPEAQNPRGDFFDTDRVRAWLSRDGDAAAVTDAALRDLRAWRGRDGFDDDVTLVIARVTANGSAP